MPSLEPASVDTAEIDVAQPPDHPRPAPDPTGRSDSAHRSEQAAGPPLADLGRDLNTSTTTSTGVTSTISASTDNGDVPFGIMALAAIPTIGRLAIVTMVHFLDKHLKSQHEAARPTAPTSGVDR